MQLTAMVTGKGITTRDRAEAEFWATHERYNGDRRLAPREYITIQEIRLVRGSSATWRVHYTVPSSIVNAAHEQADRRAHERKL